MSELIVLAVVVRGLVGQTCRAVAFRDGKGRVTLGDGTWPARAGQRHT